MAPTGTKLLYETSSAGDGNMSFNWGARDEVAANRAAFLARHGIDPGSCVAMKVSDGDVVVEVSDAQRNEIPADAIITQTRGLFLFLVTGDCLPLVIYDPVHQAVGLGHGSRKSTDKKLAQKIVAALTDKFGSRPEDIQVFIGPGVRKDSYRLRDPEQKDSPEWQTFLERSPEGEFAVDVTGYNTDQLVKTGVRRENISVSPVDTISSPDFFSHYRSRRTGEPEARFASLVGIK